VGGAKFVVFLIPCLCIHIFYACLVLYISSLSVFLFSRLAIAYDVRVVCFVSQSADSGMFPSKFADSGGFGSHIVYGGLVS
jgi:hypothetical protein